MRRLSRQQMLLCAIPVSSAVAMIGRLSVFAGPAQSNVEDFFSGVGIGLLLTALIVAANRRHC
jgi:hypothetical protein